MCYRNDYRTNSESVNRRLDVGIDVLPLALIYRHVFPLKRRPKKNIRKVRQTYDNLNSRLFRRHTDIFFPTDSNFFVFQTRLLENRNR